jgi:hypothetical protein
MNMNYFAILSTENLVEQVITAPDNSEELKIQYESLFGKKCVATFRDGSKRKRFAGIGMVYSDDLDAFIYSKPFNSWVLNNETAEWEAPQDKPADTDTEYYSWDESNLSWTKNIVFNLSQADSDLLATVSTVEELESIKDQLSEEGRAQLGLN